MGVASANMRGTTLRSDEGCHTDKALSNEHIVKAFTQVILAKILLLYQFIIEEQKSGFTRRYGVK